MDGTMEYLSDIAILLAAAVVAVPLFQTLRMGAVPGFVIAGMIVGPYGLSFIGNVSEIGHLAELGVVLLLFIIGIELNPKRLWMMRRLLFGLGTLQFVITSLALVAIAHYGLGIPLRAAVLIGPALALSSTAFVLQLLSENKMLTSEHGRASIAILLLQDLAVVPLLALGSLLTMPSLTLPEDIALALGEAVLIIALVIVIGRYLLQPVLHRVAKAKNPEVFTASAVLLVLGAAVLMENVGLSMAMGAFLAGLLIADSSFRHQVIAETQPFRGLLLGLFFMSMGMALDPAPLFSHPVMMLLLVVALIGVKALVIWPLARMFGLNTRTSLVVALLLAQSGEFALVLFTASLGSGLLHTDLFQQLLLVVILSMLATPLLARLAKDILRGRKEVIPSAPAPSHTEDDHHAPVIIIGFGRMGDKIGSMLDLAQVRFSAIDSNPSVVAHAHGQGRPVFYGDAERPAVLKALGIETAEVAIIALDNRDVAEQIVSTLRENFPQLMVLARGHDEDRCRVLKTLGADVVVSETLETSIELARLALVKVDTPDDVVSELLEDYRHTYDKPI